jgi:hypothetical protein
MEQKQHLNQIVVGLVDTLYEMSHEVERLITEIEKMTQHLEASKRFRVISSEFAELKHQAHQQLISKEKSAG